MTTRRNGFEGQTDTTAVSTGNSATSGDAFTTVTNGGGTIAYSATNPGDGLMGISFAQSGTTACVVDDASFASTTLAHALVFWYTGVPTTACRILEIRSAAGLVASILLNATGHLVMQNSAGSAITGMTSASALSASHQYRVECEVLSDASVGTAALRYYTDAQSTSAVETLSATSQNTRGGNITTVRRGIVSAVNFGSTLYMDSFQAQDGTTTPMGPFPIPPPAVTFIKTITVG